VPRFDSANPPRTIEHIRAAAGPAHRFGVWFGRRLLRVSHLSEKVLWTREGRRALARVRAVFSEVTTRDGLGLRVCRVPPADGQPKGAGPLPPVLILHGWLEVLERHGAEAAELARAGHAVTLFDMRAHGRSQGKATTLGGREVDDARQVLDAMSGAGDRGPVLVIGYSVGAVTALRLAAADRRVGGVVAMGPYESVGCAVHFFRKLVAPKPSEPWLQLAMREAAIREGFRFEDVDVAEATAGLELPVLFVAADADTIANLTDQTRRLYELKTRGWRGWHEVKGANHFTIGQAAWPAVHRLVADVIGQMEPAAAARSGR